MGNLLQNENEGEVNDMAKPETEIKNCVMEAKHLISQGNDKVRHKRQASINSVTVTIPSGYGDIVVRMVANSPYSKSHYTVFHPALGDWSGMLNTAPVVRDGEYGNRAGMPRLIN